MPGSLDVPLTGRLLLGLLAAAAAYGWFVLRAPAPAPLPETVREQLLGEPDLALDEARIRQFMDSGSLSYELIASRIRHFEHDALTRLKAPDLTMHGERGLPWRTTAGHGFIRMEVGPDRLPEELVFLRDAVQLRQKQDDGRFLTLRTEHLYVYPERQYAQTDQSVTIDTEVGRTRAAGMAADLAQGLIALSSTPEERVRTIVLKDQFK